MFFSIIIPVYNVESYLAECFDSLLAQTYQKFEVICINDGSTDNSLAIVEQYSDKFSNFKFKTIENSGLSVARNIGLSLAQGDYILYLDSDDKFRADTLMLCTKQIETHQADIIMFEAQSFVDGVDASQHDIGDYDRPIISEQLTNGHHFFNESWWQKKFIVQACCYCYKKQKYQNLQFAPGILHEDNLFTTQLLLAAKSDRVVCLNEKLFLRRYRPASIMTQAKSPRHVQGLLHCANKIADIVLVMDNAEEIKPTLAQFASSLYTQAIMTDVLVPENQKLTMQQKWLIYQAFSNIQNVKIKTKLLFWCPWLVKVKKWLIG
ncbi:glycosyltransferase family 2 protein [Aeromonas caviae]